MVEKQVLDVGAGSAILAMAAVKLGAASAIGVEIDSVAADCARRIYRLNGLKDRIDIMCGYIGRSAGERAKTADLVLANLDRQTILDLAGDLVSSASEGAQHHDLRHSGRTRSQRSSNGFPVSACRAPNAVKMKVGWR